MGVKSTPVCGCTSRSRVINYLKTREGLFRLITTYPSTMPFMQAVELAMTDFTKGRKEVNYDYNS